jgi:hypothetical protein
MKDEILLNLDNPAKLESLYRQNKSVFKQAFNSLQPELQNNDLIRFWNERLNFSKDEISWGTGKELLFVIIASLLAGVIAKFPQIFSINEEFFYQRNIGFIIFAALSAYFAWKNKLSAGKIGLISGLMLAGVIFINSLPAAEKSDTTILSCIHLLLFLWSLLGFAFVAEAGNNQEKRLAYLKYNGDLVVMTTLILIAGAIMTGITIGLFKLIGFNIEEFYFRNIVVFGLPAAPILATYLIQANPQLVGKVSPVIAKIFSPLVLLMLAVYLVAMLYSGKDPYNDRQFLLIFNALLIGVMAIIFFSVAGTSWKKEASPFRKGDTSFFQTGKPETWILFLLCLITIVVNGIALSAILFRISEWGITPNRMAVLGGNILILINLLLVTVQLFKVLSKKAEISGVGKAIAFYLPVYVIWTIVVTFIFPLIFWFK